MAEADFFGAKMAAAVEAAVRDVEAHTSAELVVAVRRRAAAWRVVDVAVGAAAGFAMLLVLLFHPAPFVVAWMPLEVLGAAIVGGLLSRGSWGLRRLLVSRAQRRAAAQLAARAAFVDLGVSRTRGRSGLLVVAFLQERLSEAVLDVGLDARALGDAWPRALAAVDEAVAAADAERFLTALRALGPILGAALPRQADDVNELPDAPVVDA